MVATRRQCHARFSKISTPPKKSSKLEKTPITKENEEPYKRIMPAPVRTAQKR